MLGDYQNHTQQCSGTLRSEPNHGRRTMWCGESTQVGCMPWIYYIYEFLNSWISKKHVFLPCPSSKTKTRTPQSFLRPPPMTGLAGSQDSHSPLETMSGAVGPEGAQPNPKWEMRLLKLPNMTFLPTQQWPGEELARSICPPRGRVQNQSMQNMTEIWTVENAFLMNSPHRIPRNPLRRRYQQHHSIHPFHPLEGGLRKRLKNVTNQESYFCEKEEKCHQKGSVDNPIGLKITAWLADQSGDRRGRETSCKAPWELQLREASGGWGNWPNLGTWAQQHFSDSCEGIWLTFSSVS